MVNLYHCGTILNMLLSINLLNRNFFTLKVQQIGSVVEFTFFTTKKAGEGAGLGLHICKQIITQQGGSIQINSAEGKTIVSVRLPV